MNTTKRRGSALVLALLLMLGFSSVQAAPSTVTIESAGPAQTETQTPPDQIPKAAAATASVAEKPAASAVPKKELPQTDPLAGRSEDLLKKFYLVDGKTYDKTISLITSLSSSLTGLDNQKDPYYLRVDKELTDKYFRHVRAYSETSHELKGDYYVAKDQSSVWRLDGEKPGLIYGSAEKMLKKSRLIVYPRYLALGSKGIVRLQTPGSVPYDIEAKSLNDGIARVTGQGYIEPVSTGRADIMVDYAVGDQKGTTVRRINVVTKEDLERMAYQAYMSQVYMDMMWYYDPWPYGWGYYPHHHHHHHHPAPPPPPRGGHRPPPPPRH